MSVRSSLACVVSLLTRHVSHRVGHQDDFLLCLGRIPGWAEKQLEAHIRQGIAKLSEREGGADVLLVWGEADAMIPHRGMRVLEKALNDAPNVRASSLSAAGAGHDDTLQSEEVTATLLSFCTA